MCTIFLQNQKRQKYQNLVKNILKIADCPALGWRGLSNMLFLKHSGLLFLATLIIT